MERISAQCQKNICINIGIKYNILEGQVYGLENQQLNQLAFDMIRDFEVQKGRIIIKSQIHYLGSDYVKFMNECSYIMRSIVKEFKLIKQMHDQTKIKHNFQRFTQKSELPGHSSLVSVVDICKQRNILVSGSSDDTVKLWDLKNNNLLKTYKFSGVYDVVLSNQGNLLAIGGGGDYSARLIDISDLNKDGAQIDFTGHTKFINRLIFSNDSRNLISAGQDHKLIFRDIFLKKELFQLNTESTPQGLSISSDDMLIATNSIDGKIRIWNIQNQKLWSTEQAHTAGAGIQFSTYQKMLVSSGDSEDSMIKLWTFDYLNQNKLFLIREFETATNNFQKIISSSCSRFIISMNNGNSQIKFIDSQSGEVVKQFQSKAQNVFFPFSQVAISKDMDIIAYGEYKKIAVWKQK